MIRILQILPLLISLTSYCQTGTLKGIIKNGVDNSSSGFITIYLELNNKKISTTNSRIDGNFEISGIPQGTYDICLQFVGYLPHKMIGISIRNDSITNLEIKYPCPNGNIESKKICPYGHIDNILPITYGLPTNKTLEKAEKGKIWLGGCVITECSPRWHCKSHNLNF